MEKDPQQALDLTRGKYFMELGTRLQRHAVTKVLSAQATREVDIAGRILHAIGMELEDNKGNTDAT